MRRALAGLAGLKMFFEDFGTSGVGVRRQPLQSFEMRVIYARRMYPDGLNSVDYTSICGDALFGELALASRRHQGIIGREYRSARHCATSRQ